MRRRDVSVSSIAALNEGANACFLSCGQVSVLYGVVRCGRTYRSVQLMSKRKLSSSSGSLYSTLVNSSSTFPCCRAAASNCLSAGRGQSVSMMAR